MYNYLLNLIFPNKCLLCLEYSDSEKSICGNCFKNINFNNDPYCKICGKAFPLDIYEDYLCGMCIKKQPIYSLARFIMKYDENSKRLIYLFKYNDKTILSDYFAKLLVNRYKKYLKDVDLIIPVPMHKLKRIYRLYNQTQYLAESISKLTNIPRNYNILYKARMTKSQTLLTQKQRMSNLNKSFGVKHPEYLKNKNILLIDDIITTGSTIKECTKTLLEYQAKSVKIFAIAATNHMI